MSSSLGDQPSPHIEPAEPNPGGVDAVEGNDHETDPVVPDLDPDDNPAIDPPAELTEAEDTDDGAESDGASEPEKETPV